MGKVLNQESYGFSSGHISSVGRSDPYFEASSFPISNVRDLHYLKCEVSSCITSYPFPKQTTKNFSISLSKSFP